MSASVTVPVSRHAELVRTRFAATIAVSNAFFAAESARLARACQDMALRFERHGRLLLHAESARRSDVSHAVVEFMHPVVVGKRALPACAVSSPEHLATVGRTEDILLVMADGDPGDAQRVMLARAAASGMLCIALLGGIEPQPDERREHYFIVSSNDPCVVQETHEMTYHVLWELVHVFLDHHGTAA